MPDQTKKYADTSILIQLLFPPRHSNTETKLSVIFLIHHNKRTNAKHIDWLQYMLIII